MSEVRLRAVELEDVDLLYEWENDLALFHYGNPSAPFSRYQLQRFIELSTGDLYVDLQLRLIIDVVTNGNRLCVGIIDAFEFDPHNLRAGVGIMINNCYRGKGYASLALKQFVEYLFSQWGLHQVIATVAVTNAASIGLFANSGFQMIGVKKDWIKIGFDFVDVVDYQLIKCR